MAGAGYKLFNTGDVLTAAQVNTYLQEQAVMRFANAAARTTALSGVLAEGMMSYLDDTNSVEVYNGSAWVSVSSDQTPLTTKGDLFTYSTTDTRLGVGNNGETLVADSSASTGLRWQGSNAAGRNIVLNSDANIWQRGTSFAAVSAAVGTGYTADRWQAYIDGTTAATISRQSASLDQLDYSIRVQRNLSNTGTTRIYLAQPIEDVQCNPVRGKTVVLSFWARKGANYSSASDALSVKLKYRTSSGNAFINPTGDVINTSVTLTSSFQRFSVTGTVLNTYIALAPEFSFVGVGTAGANDWFEITGVQLEAGSVATPFTTATGTLAGELAACQRYYERITSEAAYGYLGWGKAYGTGILQINTVFKVTKRVAPTALDTSAMSTIGFETGTTFGNTPTSLTLGTPNNTSIGYVEVTKSGSFTNGAFYTLFANNSTTAYIGWSAEL